MKWGACNQNKLLLVDYVAVNQMLYLAKFDLLLPSTFPFTPPPPPPTFSLDFCRTSFLYKPDVIQLTLTLKMTTAQVIEMSVNVNNRRVKENTHADNHTPPT